MKLKRREKLEASSAGGNLSEQGQQGRGGGQQVGGAGHWLLVEAQAVHLLQEAKLSVGGVTAKGNMNLNDLENVFVITINSFSYVTEKNKV